jgi:hypothetical protein
MNGMKRGLTGFFVFKIRKEKEKKKSGVNG